MKIYTLAITAEPDKAGRWMSFTVFSSFEKAENAILKEVPLYKDTGISWKRVNVPGGPAWQASLADGWTYRIQETGVDYFA